MSTWVRKSSRNLKAGNLKEEKTKDEKILFLKKMMSNVLRPAHSFRKPDKNVKPGAKCHSTRIATVKRRKRENKSVRESAWDRRRKRMYIILLPAKQTRCQLSNAIVVTARETLQHAAGPRASWEFILTLIERVHFPSPTFAR